MKSFRSLTWRLKNGERERANGQRWRGRNAEHVAKHARLKRAAEGSKAKQYVRATDGRFVSEATDTPPCTLGQARLMYETYLAAVCEHQGLRPREVERQLQRTNAEVRRGKGRGIFEVDRNWKAAVYARQLAMYLANTTDSIPQVLLAQVTGMTPAAVCLALQSIEDMRDHGDYDRLVEIVAAQMAKQQPEAVR